MQPLEAVKAARKMLSQVTPLKRDCLRNERTFAGRRRCGDSAYIPGSVFHGGACPQNAGRSMASGIAGAILLRKETASFVECTASSSGGRTGKKRTPAFLPEFFSPPLGHPCGWMPKHRNRPRLIIVAHMFAIVKPSRQNFLSGYVKAAADRSASCGLRRLPRP